MLTRWLGLVVGLLLLSSCAQERGPEAVALEYARALYANDLLQVYQFISSEDRRMKDEETFLRERGQVTGFALEMARQFASFIEANPVEKTIKGERATVTLRLKLPDANASEIARLVHEWDERRLKALPGTEQQRVTQKLNDLHRTGRLPILEGEESFELVREPSGWRIFLNWAGGVRVRFRAAVAELMPIEVTVTPDAVLVTPGEAARASVRATNRSRTDIVARVGHRIEPKAHADSLALLQCPLFLPVTLKPGRTEEFVSEYVILKGIPEGARELQVTYEFRREKGPD